jgi:putative oxidoreductase
MTSQTYDNSMNSTVVQSTESVRSKLKNNAHWLLRIALASVFIFHGVGKLMMLEQTANMLGISFSVTLAVALAEALGGLALIVGPFTNKLITRLGAIAIIPVMLGAIVMVHWGRWSFTAAEGFPMGGMEFQVVLILIAAYLFIRGND